MDFLQSGFLNKDAREGRFWPMVFVIGAVVMTLCALVHRHLYADGSYFVIMVLENRDYTTFDAPRLYAHFVLESPLWVAMNWLNITNVRVLSWVFGLTLFLHPIASLWACWKILGNRNRSLMILPALTWIGLTLTTSFFIISESWLGISLFWPIYFLLVFKKHQLGSYEGLFLVAGTLVSVRVYEGFFIPASLLLVLAVRRVRWQWQKAFRVDGWGFAATLCLAASFGAGLFWAINPRDPGNRISLLKGLGNLFTYAPAFLLLAAVILLIGPRWFKGMAFKVGAWLLFLATFVWALMPWLNPSSIMANKHADLRLLNNLMPFTLGLLPFLAALKPGFRPTFTCSRKLFFAGFTGAVLLWQGASCWEWSRYTKAFSRVLNSSTGYVEYAASDLSRYGFDWGWTMPCMSIVLRGIEGKPVKAVVLNGPKLTWEPFDPKVKEKRPKLERYGVNYELAAQ